MNSIFFTVVTLLLLTAGVLLLMQEFNKTKVSMTPVNHRSLN